MTKDVTPATTMTPQEHTAEVMHLTAQLRQFFRKVLQWRIIRLSGKIGPGFCSVNTDGHDHPVDATGSDILVYSLNFRNRTTNAGQLYVGAIGNCVNGGILLNPGESLTVPWAYLSEWCYNVQNVGTGDIYEVWWSG